MFYDLGAGVGKPCLIFALALPLYFATCVGLELFDSLYNRSLDLKKEYESQTEDQDVPILDFYQLDFIKNSETWAGGDLIFANATAFSDEMLY